MYQQNLFIQDGKRCPHCNHVLPKEFQIEFQKAYGYELNKDMVEIAKIIWEWCYRNKRKEFLSKQVSDDHRFLTQFQKLQYFGIIEKKKKTMYWRFTYSGYQFLKGNKALPKKVWVRKNRVEMREDLEYVTVDTAVPNWKITSFDWINDYLILPYEKIFVQ